MRHDDGDGRVVDPAALERVPPGFLNGETWKRFWSEEPNREAARASVEEAPRDGRPDAVGPAGSREGKRGLNRRRS